MTGLDSCVMKAISVIYEKMISVKSVAQWCISRTLLAHIENYST